MTPDRLRREAHGASLPECAPAYWLDYAAVVRSHGRCITPREALELHADGSERMLVDCPCACHAGGAIPDVYRPVPGPHYEAIRPFLAGARKQPSYRGGKG